MLKKFIKTAAACIAAVMCINTAAINSTAKWKYIGCMGDLNHDSETNVADLVLLAKHLSGKTPLTLENSYHINGAPYMINLSASDDTVEYLHTADMNQDGRVDVFDLILMRQNAFNRLNPPVYIWEEHTTTTTTTTSVTTTEPLHSLPFVEPPIKDLLSYLVSQGQADVVSFYVDFPDCKYEYDPDEEHLNTFMFGPEDEYDDNYPFESLNAFYKRASKGSMSITGHVFRYTAKENVACYNDDKNKLVMECYEAFDDIIDFTKFDNKGDGRIDTTIISVPKSAGDDEWWACAGPFGNSSYFIDGLNIGYVITGNEQVRGENDHYDYVSTYAHELGHCMGLPDYYIYGDVEDEGMHGYAGSELMDIDASSDFGAFSKLQLGWYRKDQILRFRDEGKSCTYTLYNAQSDNGNCLIIPRDNDFQDQFSEYFIVEFCTPTGNNSKPFWWQKIGTGIRIYHVEASLYDNGWWLTYKYRNGSAYMINTDGRRLLRLVNEVDNNTIDNMLVSGDIVDADTNGFRWYDDNDQLTIDPGITIKIGDIIGDSCTVTVQASGK